LIVPVIATLSFKATPLIREKVRIDIAAPALGPPMIEESAVIV